MSTSQRKIYADFFQFFNRDFFEFHRLDVDKFFIQTSERTADFSRRNFKSRKIPQAVSDVNFVRVPFEFTKIFRAVGILLGNGNFFPRADNFHGLRAICNFRQNAFAVRVNRSRGDVSSKPADC